MPEQQIGQKGASPNSQKACRWCKKSIPGDATICSECGHYQNRLYDNLGLANVISLLLFILSVLQFVQASHERTDAISANDTAKVTLGKVVEARTAAQNAHQEVIGIAKSFLKIAEIVPRATGNGTGLSDSDRTNLKQYSDSLKNKFNEIEKRFPR